MNESKVDIRAMTRYILRTQSAVVPGGLGGWGWERGLISSHCWWCLFSPLWAQSYFEDETILPSRGSLAPGTYTSVDVHTGIEPVLAGETHR